MIDLDDTAWEAPDPNADGCRGAIVGIGLALFLWAFLALVFVL